MVATESICELYPELIPLIDYEIRDDGNSPYIYKWPEHIARPTSGELEAAYLSAAEKKAQASLTAALNRFLDSKASERRYDNRFTCALRAAFAGPFQAEGIAFATWLDQCNITAYSIMAECKAGVRPIPTEQELIAEMPVLVWPESSIPEGAV